jgi:AcrR family transcriptional regulator
VTLTKRFSKVSIPLKFGFVMAQRSKKDLIAEAALPVFLENGIKGTSVDLVVKTSGVSKPTVYNHFPDKATLLTHVVDCWLANQAEPAFKAKTESGLYKELKTNWLNTEALSFYGLFLGEGFRAPEAAGRFKAHYDQAWRHELKGWAFEYNADAEQLNAGASNRILTALW